MGKQRPRRRCCLRAQAASESVSNWGNTYLFRTECERGKTEGDTKIPPPGSAASKSKSAEGQSKAPRDFSQSCLLVALLLPTCSSRLPHCPSSCSYTELWKLLIEQLTMLLPQATASPAYASQWTNKRCLEAPVRQWECTTGKDKLEEVSRKRASELCYPFPTSSL